MNLCKFIGALMINILSPTALLRGSCHITLCKFKVYSMTTWCMYMLQNDYHVNTFITSHSYYLCLCMVRTFKIYFLTNFQIYNTVLLTIINMPYIRSQKYIRFLIGSLYPLIMFTHVPHPSAPGNHQSTLFL